MRFIFTPLIAGRPWCGATIYEAPLGGSESAVVYLARELARRGHEVHVFVHGQPGVYENVVYHHVVELQAHGVPPCDVHVSSRWFEILLDSPAKFKVLWLHDMPTRIPTQFPADMVVCLSQAQATVWEINGAPFVEIIGDGVDLSLFSGQENRDKNRLVWTSNPDRGLYLACRVFIREILPRWPDLQLHVYGRYAVYGWPLERERWYLPPPEWLESGHIILHAPLPKLALARELMRSWALYYPTYWPETFCIAALEAQAAGTPVITCPEGALPETVRGGIVSYDIINATSQLRNARRWEKLSRWGREYATQHSWVEIARRWEEAIILRLRMKGGQK